MRADTQNLAGWPDWRGDVGYAGLVIEPPPEIARVLDPGAGGSSRDASSNAYASSTQPHRE